MSIEIKIDDATIQKIADEAVTNGVHRAITSSPVIGKAIDKALAELVIDTKQIENAIQKAVKDVTSDPSFLHDLIRKAILDKSGKISGAFDSSLRAVGKKLMIEPAAMNQVAEEVREVLDNAYTDKKWGAMS